MPGPFNFAPLAGLERVPHLLHLEFNPDLSGMSSDEKDSYLVISKHGMYFQVVNFIYTDTGGETDVRHYTNGDVPLPETDFVAWALLPELN